MNQLQYLKTSLNEVNYMINSLCTCEMCENTRIFLHARKLHLETLIKEKELLIIEQND